MNISGKEITKENIIYVSDFFYKKGLRAINVRTNEADFIIDEYDAYELRNTTSEFALNQIQSQLQRWVEQSKHGTPVPQQ